MGEKRIAGRRINRLKPNKDGQMRFMFAINPDKYAEDRALVEFVDAQLAKGYGIREVVTDALLHRAGHTPEMFAKLDQRKDHALLLGIQHLLEQQSQTLLMELARYLRDGIRDGSVVLPDGDETAETADEWLVGFVNNFKKSRGG